MTEVSTIIVTRIPIPASDDHIIKHKNIRLSMLSTDPEAFGSKYEIQALFSHEKWREIVSTKGRTTLFAVTRSDNGSDKLAHHDEDWTGSLSILAPEMLLGEEIDYPSQVAEAVKDGSCDVYMLVGMWVHPDHRGKGVGSALVEHAISVVRSFSSSTTPQASDTPIGSLKEKKVLMLEVHNTNDAARGLYLKMGFETLVDNLYRDYKAVKSWMMISL